MNDTREPREEDFLHHRHRRARLYPYTALTFLGLLLVSRVPPRGAPQPDLRLLAAFGVSIVLSVVATGVSRRRAPFFVVAIVAVWAITAWYLRPA